MSTEHQKYSTESQMRAIAEYAGRHRYVVVRTYYDHGKSGLTIDRRAGLQRLIADVESGVADFSTVLVYDISRWGRFQDTDESAYYEFVCRRNGIAVLYCEEPFENDGSPFATIVKNIKRAMAAEYSRELSKKCFAGQVLNAERGFRAGGPAPFGYRRRVVHDGVPGIILERGQLKGVVSDRIVLVPGPTKEVRTVRWMFRAFAYGDLEEKGIARALNTQGIKTILGNRWTFPSVASVLRNEAYLGTLIWNRSTQKLHTRVRRNGREQWIRSEGAFPPLIDRALFDAAQGAVRARQEHHTPEHLLVKLRELFQLHGRVTAALLDRTPGMPSASTYHDYFGSLTAAQQQIGLKTLRSLSSVALCRALRLQRESILLEIAARLTAQGVPVERDKDRLIVGTEFALCVEVMRCQITPTLRWRKWSRTIRSSSNVDLVVSARMNDKNDCVRDYLLLPADIASGVASRASAFDAAALDAYRSDTLDPLYAIATRANA